MVRQFRDQLSLMFWLSEPSSTYNLLIMLRSYELVILICNLEISFINNKITRYRYVVSHAYKRFTHGRRNHPY